MNVPSRPQKSRFTNKTQYEIMLHNSVAGGQFLNSWNWIHSCVSSYGKLFTSVASPQTWENLKIPNTFLKFCGFRSQQ